MSRGAITLGTILLLLAPLGMTSGLRAPIHDAPPFAPLDVDDATLLRLLARDVLPPLDAHALPALDELPTLPDLVLRVGARAGATMTPEDVAMFAALDPRVDAPVRVMLAAMDAAWALRDAAFADLSPAEQEELAALIVAGELESPRGLQLVGGVRLTPLVEAAILILDTAESIVVPQLQAAAASGAWPATAVADPVGILRLGGTGNDVETLNRVLQIDPRGDDLYRNNAGGTNLDDLLNNPTALRYQTAVSIDLAGNDHYNKTVHEAQGGAAFGVGILLDYAGGDLYFCGLLCQGAGQAGVGLHHDYGGDDRYYGGGDNKGRASQGIGILRDDDGADHYICGGGCGGYAFLYPSTGLLWDRGGADTYDSRESLGAFGWGSDSGRGWIADEGTDIDSYSTVKFGAAGHGCNDCTWSAGSSPLIPTMERGGRGNDGQGGLAFLMTAQGSGLV